jgi:DNA-binding NarL/FixJ family response regulator
MTVIGTSRTSDRVGATHPGAIHGESSSAAGVPAQRQRVVIADGDPIARRMLRDVFQAASQLVVIAEASDGMEALELALHYRPEILVTELDLPRIDGIEATRRIHARAPEVRIVFLAVRDSPEFQLAALRAGATGYLAKATPLPSVTLALYGLARGEAIVSRATASHLVKRLRRVPEAGHGLRPIRSDLTAREWEVLDLLCAGESLPHVAKRLKLAETTVLSHLKHTMRKVDVHSREELRVVADRLCRLQEDTCRV